MMCFSNYVQESLAMIMQNDQTKCYDWGRDENFERIIDDLLKFALIHNLKILSIGAGFGIVESFLEASLGSTIVIEKWQDRLLHDPIYLTNGEQTTNLEFGRLIDICTLPGYQGTNGKNFTAELFKNDVDLSCCQNKILLIIRPPACGTFIAYYIEEFVKHGGRKILLYLENCGYDSSSSIVPHDLFRHVLNSLGTSLISCNFKPRRSEFESFEVIATGFEKTDFQTAFETFSFITDFS